MDKLHIPPPPAGYKPVVVVLDNDEAIGSWGDLSVVRHVVRLTGTVDDPSVFAIVAQRYHCVRPHLGFLYDVLVSLREAGYVHSIVMCTAASNDNGWVGFLARMLEAWYTGVYQQGRPPLAGGRPVYDHIVHRELLETWQKERALPPRDNCTLKDMAHIRHILDLPAHTPAIVVDDRVNCIVDSTAAVEERVTVEIEVPPYAVAVDGVEAALRVLDAHGQPWEAMRDAVMAYRLDLRYSMIKRSKSPAQFTVDPASDTALLAVVVMVAHTLGLPLFAKSMDTMLSDTLASIDAAVTAADVAAAAGAAMVPGQRLV